MIPSLPKTETRHSPFSRSSEEDEAVKKEEQDQNVSTKKFSLQSKNNSILSALKDKPKGVLGSGQSCVLPSPHSAPPHGVILASTDS